MPLDSKTVAARLRTDLVRSLRLTVVMTDDPQRRRLLLVDDDAVSLSVTARMLAKQFALTAVESGEEALWCFFPGVFDIVLTDYRMPSMTGIELLEQLQVRDPRVRRVLMSAGSVLGIDGYIGAGLVHAFLAKPFDLRSALEALYPAID
jgi:CheY-like chemotaxis protein